MKNIWVRNLLLLLAISILVGCFGNAPISRYYLLDYVPTTPEPGQIKSFPITVRIKDFSIAEAYGRPEIVYRKSAHELRFYNFHQWAVKPEHILSDMIFKHIQVSEIFSNTVKSVVDSDPDYVMKGQILAIEVGSRGTKPLKKLWERIKHLKPYAVATDEWRVYRKVIPASLLIQTKKLTSTVESVNGQVRNYLARFNRRTKRYSKSPFMAEISLYLLWIHKLC